jgi:hypothetical protein
LRRGGFSPPLGMSQATLVSSIEMTSSA